MNLLFLGFYILLISTRMSAGMERTGFPFARKELQCLNPHFDGDEKCGTITRFATSKDLNLRVSGDEKHELENLDDHSHISTRALAGMKKRPAEQLLLALSVSTRILAGMKRPVAARYFPSPTSQPACLRG